MLILVGAGLARRGLVYSQQGVPSRLPSSINHKSSLLKEPGKPKMQG